MTYCTFVIDIIFVIPQDHILLRAKVIIIITLIPWQGGKPLVWDVTVVSTLAQSYVDRAATGVGTVAEMAAERKAEKYHNLSSDHIFQPIAMENLGAFSSSSLSS